MSQIIEINNLDAEGLLPFTHLNETQLRHYFEPNGGIFIAESPTVITRALDAGLVPLSFLVEHKYLETEARDLIARCPDTPVYTSSLDVLMGITGYHLTRGILAAMHRPVMPSVEEVLQNATRIAVLENVENPTNIGAIFRSAAALNMDAILVTPECADPFYRRAIRVGVGTIFQVPWTYLDAAPSWKPASQRDPKEKKPHWPQDGMQKLKDLGFKTAAMALRDNTISIADPKLAGEEKLAVILGNEGDGLLQETIDLCDYTVKIPMSNGVDSLNVAAASAVAFWELGHNK